MLLGGHDERESSINKDNKELAGVTARYDTLLAESIGTFNCLL